MTTTIQTDAEHLALQLAYEPAVVELRDARAALDTDQDAREMIERYQHTQFDLATKQRSGAELSDAEITTFQELQGSVQTHPTIRRLIDAEQDATAMLTEVAAAIDEASGIAFTRLAAKGGC